MSFCNVTLVVSSDRLKGFVGSVKVAALLTVEVKLIGEFETVYEELAG